MMLNAHGDKLPQRLFLSVLQDTFPSSYSISFFRVKILIAIYWTVLVLFLFKAWLSLLHINTFLILIDQRAIILRIIISISEVIGSSCFSTFVILFVVED